MPHSDLLNEFISNQNRMNIEMASSLARVEQMLKDNSQHLFGGDGQKGILPYMADEHEKMKTRLGTLEVWRTGTVKWIAGAAAVLGVEGTLLGAWFTHLATGVKGAAVQAVADAAQKLGR